MEVRSLFLSDAHIGSYYCQSNALLDILEQYTPEYLYLVGDFVDGWKVKRGFFWPDHCNDIVRRILDLVEHHKTQVRYAVGNHDEFLRTLGPTSLSSVDVQNEFIHETIDGKKLRVIHGDYLDNTVTTVAWLAHLGDRALSIALWLSRLTHRIQKIIGIRYWSFTNFLRRQIQKALLFINRFETIIIMDTARLGYDGVICGHIHKPDMYAEDDFLYYNCGDWVEHGTALVEHLNGEMELVASNKFMKFPACLLKNVGYDWPG